MQKRTKQYKLLHEKDKPTAGKYLMVKKAYTDIDWWLFTYMATLCSLHDLFCKLWLDFSILYEYYIVYIWKTKCQKSGKLKYCKIDKNYPHGRVEMNVTKLNIYIVLLNYFDLINFE